MRVKIVCFPDPVSADTAVKTGPTPEHSRPGELPEDVIHEIVKYLTDSEALKLSTLSKRFHATFPPRPTDVTCKSHRKAASLRKQLVQSTNGAAHLVSLELRCTSLAAADVSTVRDILAGTPNLRSLACGALEFGYPEVRIQIGHLSHLSRLQIYQPSQSDLNVMVYPQSLSSLCLIELKGGVSWSDLGRKLSGLTRLTELTLDRCPLDDPGLDRDLDVDGADAPTPLPTVTSLEVLSTDLPFDFSYFARMFPSLDTLYLGEDSMFSTEDRRHPEDSNRVLQKVTYVGSVDSETIPWEVRHLAVPVPENNRLYLDSFCNVEKLVGLSIRLPAFTSHHWEDRIEPFITDVHILELEAFKADFPKTIRFFADLFAKHDPELYGDFPVQVLSIAAPQAVGRSKKAALKEDLLAKLFDHASYGFPNLRYFALASPPHIPQAFSDLSGDRAPWRWWRIIRSGQNVEFREIPAWEGERVRKYFRDADREKAKNFDEDFSALR